MNFLPILDTLAPVFLVVAVGALLRLIGFLKPAALADTNRLSYWVGLPCLTFVSIATGPFDPGPAFGLFLTVLLATVAGGACAWFAAAYCGADRRARGTFVQAAFRGNLAFIGLPVIVYAMPGNAEVRAAALVAFAPVVAGYSLAAVLVLQASRSGSGAGRSGLLRNVLLNPQLLASLAGLPFAVLHWPIPAGLVHSLEALGHMALPLALIGIGGALVGTRLHRSLRPVFAAAAIKCALLPLAGALLAWGFGLSPEHARAALVLLATPTAAASYVLARQMDGDEALASGSILASTLLSAPALALVLALA